MRRHILLAPAQRERLAKWVGSSNDSLIRLHVLSADDRALIQQRRRPENRLGFALHLCCLRETGRAWLPGEAVPAEVLSFVGHQLGIEPAAAGTYARQRVETHYAHVRDAQRALGLEPFSISAYREASRRLVPIAMDDDRPTHLINAVMSDLRRRLVTVPRITVIERMCFEVRGRARRRVYHTLTHDLSEACRARLDALLSLKPGTGVSGLSWLRQAPTAASATNMITLAERVANLREVGIESERARRVSAERRTQLAREGQRASAQHLGDVEAPRRHATLIATVSDLSETLTDSAMNMFERLMARMFNKAERRQSQDLQRNARTLHEKVRLYARIGRGVIGAHTSGADPYQAIERVLTWDRFEDSVEDAERLTYRESIDTIGRLSAQYGTLRRYVPIFLATFQFEGIAAAGALLAAIDVLRKMNATRQRKLPADVPTRFVPARWRPYVFRDDGIDRRYYEICVLSELRDRLRAGDVWVPGSRHYRELNDHLVTLEEFEQLRDAGDLPVAVEVNVDDFLTVRKAHLHERLSTVAQLACNESLQGVTLGPRT